MDTLNNDPAEEQFVREMRAVSVTDHLSDCIPYDRQNFCCFDCQFAEIPANIMEAITAFCTGDVRCRLGQPTQTDDTACPYYTGKPLHYSPSTVK